MNISRRGFLKILAAAPAVALVAKSSLAAGIIKVASEMAGASVESSPAHRGWHLAIFDTQKKKLLFNNTINGEPKLQAAIIAKRIANVGVLTVWLTPVTTGYGGDLVALWNPNVKQEAYYHFNNLKL